MFQAKNNFEDKCFFESYVLLNSAPIIWTEYKNIYMKPLKVPLILGPTIQIGNSKM